MFGIDIGISVSSISCITDKNEVLDTRVIFGNKQDKNEWRRVMRMAEIICNEVELICKGHDDMVIRRFVGLEEPVYPYRTMNPRSYFNMSCLYALIRKRLVYRKFIIYSINPVSVKATAKALAFKKKTRLPLVLAKQGRLTKKGMIRAYFKVVGHKPIYSNQVGRETLADSFFIARTAIDRRRVGLFE